MALEQKGLDRIRDDRAARQTQMKGFGGEAHDVHAAEVRGAPEALKEAAHAFRVERHRSGIGNEREDDAPSCPFKELDRPARVESGDDVAKERKRY